MIKTINNPFRLVYGRSDLKEVERKTTNVDIVIPKWNAAQDFIQNFMDFDETL